MLTRISGYVAISTLNGALTSNKTQKSSSNSFWTICTKISTSPGTSNLFDLSQTHKNYSESSSHDNMLPRLSGHGTSIVTCP
jgi:hypothetical protein